MKMLARSQKMRAKLRLTRSRGLFVVALLAGGVLGPLAGIAVGAGATTTETITAPPGCTIAAKTTTTKTTSTVTTTTTTTTTSTTTSTSTTTGGTTTSTVTATNPSLSPTTETLYDGETVSIQIAYDDPNNPTLTYTYSPLPTGLYFASTVDSGEIEGTVGSDGPADPTTVDVSASDGSSGSVEIDWSYTAPPTQTQTTPTTTIPVTTTTVTTPPPVTVPTCTSSTVTKVTIPPYVPPTNTAPAPAVISVPKNNPFAEHAMWIWEMPATDHGNIAQIIAQAKLDGIGTLIIKNGDGTTPWSQFNKTLVNEIHAAGLRVCGWQYVYGTHPLLEAEVGADAKKDGANCLVIDAEVQYQGRYVAAQTYIKDLRQRVGKTFSIALAGFPYVQYHTNFPYSVFLGSNGAQYNAPQMYWIDIGTTVPYVFQTTYEYNEIYQRPIYPLGQLYSDPSGSPTASSIGQFNTLAKDYHASGLSWWDFQSATSGWLLDTFHANSAAPANFVPATNAATLVKGNLGDQVIWAQEHLDGAGAKLGVDGDFGPATLTAVERFQLSHGLTPSGQINGRTWDALLRYKAVAVTWSSKAHVVYATIARAGKKIRSAVSLRRAVPLRHG
jgi:hypothetical protein